MYNESLSFVKRNLQKVEHYLKSESIVVLEYPVYTDKTDRDNFRKFLNALCERNLDYKLLDSKEDGKEKLVVTHLSENVKTNRDVTVLSEMIRNCLSLFSKFNSPIKTSFEYICLGDRDKVCADIRETFSKIDGFSLIIKFESLNKIVVEVWK